MGHPCASRAGHTRGVLAPRALGAHGVSCAPRAGHHKEAPCASSVGCVGASCALCMLGLCDALCVCQSSALTLGVRQPCASCRRRSDLSLMLAQVGSILQYWLDPGSNYLILNFILFSWLKYVLFKALLISHFDLCSSLSHKSSCEELSFGILRRSR